jgi:SAM-dependent methyltransferase
MRPHNLARVVMGSIVLIGLLLWQPLAYFAGTMMIFAGFTGICLLEKLFGKILGVPAASCALATEPPEQGLRGMSGEEITRAVSEKYSAVALTPDAEFNFPVGRDFAESVGYPADVLNRLPVTMSDSFTGAGNPQSYVNGRSGETLLDLGCGAGLDLYFFAKAVGEKAKLYGLDISRAMLDKARRNLESVGVRNIDFLHGPADAIPLPDASVDLVTANGIYNLSPDKDGVMREVYRVLKPGGRTVFAEIVLKAELPREIRKNMDDWFRCIGGALTEADFLSRLNSVGFRNAQILWKGRNARTGHKLAVCAVIRAEK